MAGVVLHSNYKTVNLDNAILWSGATVKVPVVHLTVGVEILMIIVYVMVASITTGQVRYTSIGINNIPCKKTLKCDWLRAVQQSLSLLIQSSHGRFSVCQKLQI